MKKLFAAIIATILILGTLAPLGAQEQSQTMKLLTLKSAQLQLQKTKGDFERSLKLKEQGLTSEQEFSPGFRRPISKPRSSTSRP